MALHRRPRMLWRTATETDSTTEPLIFGGRPLKKTTATVMHTELTPPVLEMAGRL